MTKPTVERTPWEFQEWEREGVRYGDDGATWAGPNGRFAYVPLAVEEAIRADERRRIEIRRSKHPPSYFS